MSKQSMSLIADFGAAGIKIPKLQMSSIGGLSFAAAFDRNSSTIMVNEAAAGMDFDPDTAVSKALVEYLERMAFLEGIANEGDGEPALSHQRGLVELIQDVEQRAQIARHALQQILRRLER